MSPSRRFPLPLLPLTALLALGPAGAQEGPDPALEEEARSRPLHYEVLLHHGAPYVELELGGASGLFLVDTGANTSGVDGGWLEESGCEHSPGERSVVGGTTGNLTVESARFERLDLARGYFHDAQLKVQDFSGFTTPDDRGQAGLLGTDLLSAYQLRLDYEARRVELRLRHERQEPPPGFRATSVRYDLNLPTVNVRVGGVDLPCRLDSGAAYLDEGPYLDVNQPALRALQAARVPLEEVGAIFVRGVGGGQRLPLYRGPEGRPLNLELGPVRLEDVTLVVHARGTLAIRDPVTLASASVLRPCGEFILDPFDRLLWLPAGE